MAAFDFSKVLRQSGRLCKDPTSLSGSYPYGGTALGYAREGFTLMSSPGRMVPLKAVDRKRGFNYIFTGDGEIALKTDFIQNDDDARRLFYPGGLTSAGATSGRRLVQLPGTLAAGDLADGLATKFLFVPDDVRRGLFILFRKAFPWPEESAEQYLQRRNPFSLPVVFRALVDTSASSEVEGLVVIGDKRDITL